MEYKNERIEPKTLPNLLKGKIVDFCVEPEFLFSISKNRKVFCFYATKQNLKIKHFVNNVDCRSVDIIYL